jgi:dTDP-4-amino-4,6-dideoxygalactose transaminase
MNGLKLLGSAEGGYMVGGAELAAGALPGERLSDLIAVLALRSLETLDANLARRSALARTYRSATKLDVVDSPERAAWFRFIVRLSGPDAIERFIVDAGKSGIVVRRPIMPHPLDGYLKPGGDASAPVAWRLWESFASVPLYPALSDEDARVVEGFLHGWS